MADIDPQSQFLGLWISAITRYKQDTKYDILDGRLEANSSDALLVVIEREQEKFKEYWKKGERVRNAIKPVLELVNRFSETVGESVAMVHPPAKAVSVAVRVLLQAAKDVSANYDMIIWMFGKVKSFIERLSVYAQHEITTPLKKIIVETLAQLLVVLGVATKSMKRKRPGKDLVELDQISLLMTI